MEHAEKPQEKALEVTALPTGATPGGAVARDTGKVEAPPKAKPVSEVSTSKEKAAGAGKKKSNRVRKARIDQMMSKAELARRANLSVLTIDRVEKGFGCRMDTKRKILEALGLSLADRVRVFGEEE